VSGTRLDARDPKLWLSSSPVKFAERASSEDSCCCDGRRLRLSSESWLCFSLRRLRLAVMLFGSSLPKLLVLLLASIWAGLG
jgi:hypothetical protein